MDLNGRYLFTLLIGIVWHYVLLAQPPVTASPNITYQTPKLYYVTVPITPLVPTNTGGAVPPTVYGTVATIAGGTRGDADGAAAAAAFNNPAGVAVDAANNIYVADQANNKIKKITPGGVVTTYAGNGINGTVNGAAMAASFKKPNGIAVDLLGNVYVTQLDDGLIRKIAPDGTVSTFAGTPPGGYLDGPSATAQFNNPFGLYSLSNGDLLVAEHGNHGIRRISGGVVSTVAGTGSSGFNNGAANAATFATPTSVTLDAAGNIYTADFGNQVIRKIAGNVVSNFAGSGITGNADGQAPVASFNGPFGLAFDGTGNSYFSDQNNYTIRRISNTGTVVVIAGNNVPGGADGVYTAATFISPQSMVLDYQGNLILSDNGINSIRKVVVTGYTINRALPPGLVLDPKTGIITGTPTAASPATDYIITAYNAGGSHTTIVNIKVDPIGLSFPNMPGKLICDADFDPGATSNFPITYTSSNPAVATIINGKVHIVGLGTTIITAYNGFISLQQPLIVANPVPPITTVTATNNNTCVGTEITFSASPKGAGYTYTWRVNGVANGQTQDTFNSSTLSNTDQVTCVVTNNFTCVPAPSAHSAPIIVGVLQKANMQITISTTTNKAVCPGTPVTFTSTLQNVPDQPLYQWQVNGTNVIVNGTGPSFSSTQLNNGDEVSCSITSAGTCLVSQTATSNSLTAAVLPESECIVKIPNTFTPNGDGYNDTWNVYLPSGYYNALVSIYNRYGIRVFQSNGYNTPWNGTVNGKPLPAGTYYYIIEPKGVAARQSGSVVILR